MGIIVFLLCSILVVLVAILKVISRPAQITAPPIGNDEPAPQFMIPEFKPFTIPEIEENEESRFADGPIITPAKQKIIDKQMDRFLEENPNIGFFQDYPHYVERYLEKIDLSELDEALGKKGE